MCAPDRTAIYNSNDYVIPLNYVDNQSDRLIGYFSV